MKISSVAIIFGFLGILQGQEARASWSCLDTYYKNIYRGTTRLMSDREVYYPGVYTVEAGRLALGRTRGKVSPRYLGPIISGAAFLSLFGIVELMDLTHTVAWPGLAARDFAHYLRYGSTLKLMTHLQLLIEVITGRASFSDQAGMKEYVQAHGGMLYAEAGANEVDRFFSHDAKMQSYMVQTLFKSKPFQKLKLQSQSVKEDSLFLRDLVGFYQNSEIFCNPSEGEKLYTLKQIAHSVRQLGH